MGRDSILIVEFARELRRRGLPFADPLKPGRHVRLRPLMMSTFATLLGFILLALEAGSEQ